MKNKIILVGGYCATGKSTFSRKLSDLLGIPCFNKDTIKESLGDSFGPDNNMVFEKGSAAAFTLMLHITESFLRAGKTCILESNFKMKEAAEIKTLLETYNAECLCFIFTGDLEALCTRYDERDSQRHWVHGKTNGNREAFIRGQIKGGLAEIAIGTTIVTDATRFEKVNYDDLFAAAGDFIIS